MIRQFTVARHCGALVGMPASSMCDAGWVPDLQLIGLDRVGGAPSWHWRARRDRLPSGAFLLGALVNTAWSR